MIKYGLMFIAGICWGSLVAYTIKDRCIAIVLEILGGFLIGFGTIMIFGL